MTNTLRTLGLSSLLVLGTTLGALAATTTDTTVAPAPDNGVVTGHTVQTAPPNANAPNGQMTYNNQETTSPGNQFVTGDGRVGPAAPSAGAKLGGGGGKR